MKRREGLLSTLVVVSLLFAACTGSSDDVADATVVPTVGAEPTEVEAATTDPTPTVGPVAVVGAVGDEDRIAAAVARLDAEIAAGEGPEATIAYDLLESSVDEDGFVTLRICAWTGETVFDTVRDSLYRTDVADDGTVTASHVTSPVGPGECLNSTLIDSALDFIDEFEAYWADVAAAPTRFGEDSRTSILMTDDYRARAEELISPWIEDNLYFEASTAAGEMASTAAADILYRRYRDNDLEILEIVVCRDMNPEFGAYRDGVLVDDSRGAADPGLHAVDAYQMVAAAQVPGQLTLAGTDGLVWSDCFATDDWPGAANVWRSRNVDLEVLPT